MQRWGNWFRKRSSGI